MRAHLGTEIRSEAELCREPDTAEADAALCRNAYRSAATGPNSGVARRPDRSAEPNDPRLLRASTGCYPELMRGSNRPTSRLDCTYPSHNTWLRHSEKLRKQGNRAV